jgi:lipoprotein-anchoring transpeptidase ErfK/SrfK
MRLPGVGFCATKVLMMPLLALSPQFRTLLAAPFLAAMLALPVNAETNPNGASSEAQSKPADAETDTSTAPKPPEAATQEQNGTEDSEAAAPAPAKPKSTVVINIDKSTQEMTVFVDGVQKYSWPVSTGRPEYATPSGNYKPTSMNEMWYSKQWDNSPMPHSIFYMKDGHAIHGTHETKNLGRPASHGCVRLAPQNAATLFTLVKATGMENVGVILTGTTPGGEGPRVADRPSRQQPQAYPPWFDRGDDYQQQRPRRRGLFGRRWFQPYGPQGYYAPRGNYNYRGIGPHDY